MTLRTLNYGNYGIFLIMIAGCCPSAVPVLALLFSKAPCRACRGIKMPTKDLNINGTKQQTLNPISPKQNKP